MEAELEGAHPRLLTPRDSSNTIKDGSSIQVIVEHNLILHVLKKGGKYGVFDANTVCQQYTLLHYCHREINIIL